MYLGIDFGTTGCRAVVIDAHKSIIAEASQALPSPERIQGRIQQAPSIWLQGLDNLFHQLSNQLDLRQIKRLAIDGTSGSVLICDHEGKPLSSALMYNDSSSQQAVELIKQACPDVQHLTRTATSGLPKAIQLTRSSTQTKLKILNQADYLSNYLTNRWGFSDYHNALKLGYDVVHLEWPEWIQQLLPAASLPNVLEPGQELGLIQPEIAEQYGLSADLIICAGSTDANASFMATASTQPGDAVTSLGSTLVLKILNETPIEQLESGIYSHKLGDLWLVGGASNGGANVLRKYFTDQQLVELSNEINLDHETGLNFYPLISIGERFPVYDPAKQPVLTPRPDSDVEFLQAILEGLSCIEKTGYEKLLALGATRPGQIKTTGGGAKNPQWTAMRSKKLGIPVTSAEQSEACYGTALLALEGLEQFMNKSITSGK